MTSEIKFKFSIQPYQTRAVESVVDVFRGQGYSNPDRYEARDERRKNDLIDKFAKTDEDRLRYGNAPIAIGYKQLLENVNAVQSQNNLRQSQLLFKSPTPDKSGKKSRTLFDAPSASKKLATDAELAEDARKFDDGETLQLDVEMETGTGKTYVYIKTIFELNKKYGWTKFVVVVPSIAIREGVRKSFDITATHFQEHYGKKASVFIYDSKTITELKAFGSSADIKVMIVNVQAFNARGEDARRIRREHEEFENYKPIESVSDARPILILDEPQKMSGAATKDALKEFRPLFILNYSATHKEHHNLLYALDALDAFREKLVKRIRVKGFSVHNLHGCNRYLYLSQIVVSQTEAPAARIEYEYKLQSGAIRRNTRKFKFDDDLFAISGGLEEYRGYRVNDVDPVANVVSFTNGLKLSAGDVVGDAQEMTLRRAQIRETIRSHFEKERALFREGIKVLSLFFIDRVANYRQYDDSGEEINGDYGKIFEKEYREALDETVDQLDELTNPRDAEYAKYLRGISPEQTHAGYFSIDKTGRKTDGETKRRSDSSEDVSAYDLILKNKERLLSFEEPTRFIFTHSALREGWDNPNVFQICVLKKEGESETQKRQEVGRGLRLCVDKRGDRMDVAALGADRVHDVNELTVIAATGYREYVDDLQKELKADLYDRPRVANVEYFDGKTVNNNERTSSKRLEHKDAVAIYHYLVKNDYINDDESINQEYKTACVNETLAPLPDDLVPFDEDIHRIIQYTYDEDALGDIVQDGRATRVESNDLNANFKKEEFKRLWESISRRYYYRVSFDSKELIDEAIAALNKKLFVTKVQIVLTDGVQKDLLDFKISDTTTHTAKRPKTSTSAAYDLVGDIAKGAVLTRRTVAEILSGISPTCFAQFAHNPEEFITKATRIILEAKASIFVKSIYYAGTEDRYGEELFTISRRDFNRLFQPKNARGKTKSVQDYIEIDGYAKDGQSVERKFADELETRREVSVYAKLPKGFAIPTPVGNYSPDWAIVFTSGSERFVYFVAETKGSLDSLQLRPIEKAKIDCARTLFRQMTKDLAGKGNAVPVHYDVADTYDKLWNVVLQVAPEFAKGLD